MVELFKKISEIDIKEIELESLELLLPSFGMNGESVSELPKEKMMTHLKYLIGPLKIS